MPDWDFQTSYLHNPTKYSTQIVNCIPIEYKTALTTYFYA